ncbi:MAG: tetratricopeptide repeat protein [Alphaproteobacteria bacterium]
MRQRIKIAALALGLMMPLTTTGPVAAADATDRDQQYDLGLAYLRGQSVPLDEARGATLLEAAANAGNAAAQLDLSALYRTGRGVSRNGAKAFKWLSAAADQGFSTAQYHLARAFHMDDLGMGHDPALAAHWYHAAATQGHVDAQIALGGLYLAGIGVMQSRAMAMAWYNEAAGESHHAKRLADFLARQLSPKERKAAKLIDLNAPVQSLTGAIAAR